VAVNTHFKEALATLSRALPVILFRAGIFVAGGFMVIIVFAMALVAFRLAGGARPAVAIVFTALAFLSWWISGRALQRFFLYRQRAAILFLFSGYSAAAPGLAAATQEAGRLFPDYSRWEVLNRGLRRALSAFYRGGGEFPTHPAVAAGGRFSGAIDLLAVGALSQAILALVFSRGGTDAGRSVREGLALYFLYGVESRRLARQWLIFSAAGLAFVFLCLVLPNWFFFKSAGAPVEIGIVLAAAIAWLLHQAFIQPLVLAGVAGALLAETRGKNPDLGLCEKLSSLVPDTALPGKRMD
jgi:hypothetical protein